MSVFIDKETLFLLEGPDPDLPRGAGPMSRLAHTVVGS